MFLKHNCMIVYPGRESRTIYHPAGITILLICQWQETRMWIDQNTFRKWTGWEEQMEMSSISLCLAIKFSFLTKNQQKHIRIKLWVTCNKHIIYIQTDRTHLDLFGDPGFFIWGLYRIWRVSLTTHTAKKRWFSNR